MAPVTIPRSASLQRLLDDREDTSRSAPPAQKSSDLTALVPQQVSAPTLVQPDVSGSNPIPELTPSSVPKKDASEPGSNDSSHSSESDSENDEDEDTIPDPNVSHD